MSNLRSADFSWDQSEEATSRVATTDDPSITSDPSQTLIENQKPKITNSHTCSTNLAYEASLKARISKKESKLRGFFFQQRNRVLAKLDHPANGFPSPSRFPSPSHTGRGVRGEGSPSHDSADHDAASIQDFTNIFNPTEETALLLKKLTPLLRADLEHGFGTLLSELSSDPSHLSYQSGASRENSLTLPINKLNSFLKIAEARVKAVNQTTFEHLEISLQESQALAESREQLAQRIKAVFQDASDRRAEPIADAETVIAVNSGRFFAMQEASVEKKGWQTANDAKVRPAHAQAQMDYAGGIPITEPFIVNGEPLMFPGDPSGSIGNIINCRCYTFPILTEQ